MNQILYTSNGKAAGPLPIPTIVRFYAICMIILGVVFFGKGAYNLFAVSFGDSTELDNTIPIIEFAKDGNIATISVTHNKGISRIEYNWNDEERKLVSGDGQDEVVINDINLLPGINILHVEATDVNGKSAKSEYEYTYDGIYINYLVNANGGDLKLIASDVKGLSYMTYKLNNGEEIKVLPEEDNTMISYTITPNSGENTLSITAVNTSNISQTRKFELTINRRPDITCYIRGTDLFVRITDEEGLATVKHQINAEEEEVINLNGEKEYTFSKPVGEDRILVTITAVDIKGVEYTLKGKQDRR